MGQKDGFAASPLEVRQTASTTLSFLFLFITVEYSSFLMFFNCPETGRLWVDEATYPKFT